MTWRQRCTVELSARLTTAARARPNRYAPVTVERSWLVSAWASSTDIATE